MRRLTVHFEIAFGKDEPEPSGTEWREGYSIAERAPRDDPDERAELDHRRPIGFAPLDSASSPQTRNEPEETK